jgi:hypothetical protein
MSRSADKQRPRPQDADRDTSSYEQPQGAPDPATEPNARNPRLPHERDESARAAGDRLKEKPTPSGREISQAHEDVERGLVDTDRRGIPDDIPTRKSS